MQTSYPCALLVFAVSARLSEHLAVPAARTGLPRAAHQRGRNKGQRKAQAFSQTRRKGTASHLSAAPVARHRPRDLGRGGVFNTGLPRKGPQVRQPFFPNYPSSCVLCPGCQYFSVFGRVLE